MVDDKKIRAIARQVATANLSSSAVISDIKTTSFIDSEGHDALRITIVLNPRGTHKIKGDATLDTLIQIQAQLRAAGEDRLPLVEYAAEGEPEDVGDS
jgi:hypothetical protein